jgi:hypothetical protein
MTGVTELTTHDLEAVSGGIIPDTIMALSAPAMKGVPMENVSLGYTEVEWTYVKGPGKAAAAKLGK